MVFLWIITLFFTAEAEFISTKLMDERNDIMMLSTFGFLKDASFNMNISLTSGSKTDLNSVKIGIRFDKSKSGGRKDYMEMYDCALDYVNILNKNRVETNTEQEEDISRAILNFSISENLSFILVYQHKFSLLHFQKSEHSAYQPSTSSQVSNATTPNQTSLQDDQNRFILTTTLPANISIGENNWTIFTSLFFKIETESQAGLYELYLHKCSKEKPFTFISGKIEINQTNLLSYLSAGDMALPTMYSFMAIVMLLTSLFWCFYLCKNRTQVVPIHYLMAVFMFVKTLSVTFHAIDYYFLSRDGKQEAWAVVFYILHLLKGTLLFLCLLLIATGWAFIKYVLSDREKKLFVIVIPLQVVANIAYMIREESGFIAYNSISWPQLMFLFDILCFGIILISVSWSIRHLQDASGTDGKAATSINKLKLFQQFYVMVICYLYFRRVLVYLLQITLPFRYTWIHNLFYEIVSLIFFVVTGYKFRPGCDNPYLQVPQEDFKEVESHALTESGMTETVARVNKLHGLSDDEDDEETVVLLQRNKNTFV